MPILELLFGIAVLPFSASTVLRCLPLVDPPAGWIDQARLAPPLRRWTATARRLASPPT